MHGKLASATAISLVLASAVPAPADDLASQIVGVWKLQRFERCVVGAACTAFYGDRPAGYLLYSKGGVFVSQVYATTRVVPKAPDPTDEERIALHKSMFAWGGTYKVDGNKISVAVEFAWNESWKGTVRPGGTYKVEGKTLSIESSPFKSTVDGTMVVTKLTLERVD
jgi:hypothetical protein